jgi:hypothetical protein
MRKSYVYTNAKLGLVDACNFHGKLSVYEDHGGIALAQDEGRQIAKALGDNMACILQNHGLVSSVTADKTG